MMYRTPTLLERVEGGLVGLLIGDAMGVPYEFHSAENIPQHHAIEYTPPANFARSHRDVPPGTWSDDGAQALCLLASLLDRNRFDPDDFSRRLVRWSEEGYLAIDNKVFDMGGTTRRAISALQSGVAPLEAGPTDIRDNGNGSLMRVLPLALWHQGSDSDLVRDAHLQSRVTHGHMRAQVCCALYCLWARRILTGTVASWDSALRALRGYYVSKPEALKELDQSIRPNSFPEGKGSGYVVDCLHSARKVLKAANYEEVVRRAIRLGNDTDTTACVAGGIAGVRDGINMIPPHWHANLRGREIYEPLLTRLLQRTKEYANEECEARALLV